MAKQRISGGIFHSAVLVFSCLLLLVLLLQSADNPKTMFNIEKFELLLASQWNRKIRAVIGVSMDSNKSIFDGQQTKKCPPWCVTKPDASNDRVKISLDWICKNGANCGPITQDGSCYVQGDLKAMASYAFNDYFQKTRVSGGLCDYGEVAILSNIDPSHGACNFTCTPY